MSYSVTPGESRDDDRTVYQILNDASLESGDLIHLRGYSLKVSYLITDSEDVRVYAVDVNGDTRGPVDYLILDHQEEAVIHRMRDYDPGEEKIDEFDDQLDSDADIKIR